MNYSHLKTSLALTIAAAISASEVRASAPAKDVVIVANDALRFDITQIEAEPGEVIHVTLRNEGTLPKDTMGHDWILLKAGCDPMSYAMTAMSARSQGYQPTSLVSQVLAAIPLLGPKEIGATTFTAPMKPGKYYYICSCSGHAMAGMKGVLIVR